MEEKQIKFNTYPEGWEKAKSMLDFLKTDEEREAFLTGIANYLYRM